MRGGLGRSIIIYPPAAGQTLGRVFIRIFRAELNTASDLRCPANANQDAAAKAHRVSLLQRGETGARRFDNPVVSDSRGEIIDHP